VKVYVLPADPHGCGHYRLVWPANVLQQQGWDITVMPPHENSGFLAKVREEPDGRKTLTSVRIPHDADVIVVQRPAHFLQPQMVEMLRANKIAVVVDMDDDMSNIHPDNIAFNTYRHRAGADLSHKWVMESCKRATLVTTSTRKLQKVYAKHGRGLVLDNYVPEAYLGFGSPSSGFFGWAGTTKSHPTDLQVTGVAVRGLIEDGYRFKVVGGYSSVQKSLKLQQQPEVTGSVPLQDWARVIGESLDVGMAPLCVSEFNSAKSRLKPIEYMSVGVPWVGSPREEYRRVHRESGCGLLAETPKDWYRNLKRLMDDEVLRKEQSEAGREYMVTQTYQQNAWRWAEAWTKALEIERG
jgi:glycosyl transferase family 1